MSITGSPGRAALAAMFVHGGSAAAGEPGKRMELLLEAGIAPRVAAVVLAGSLVPTTHVGRPF